MGVTSGMLRTGRRASLCFERGLLRLDTGLFVRGLYNEDRSPVLSSWIWGRWDEHASAVIEQHLGRSDPYALTADALPERTTDLQSESETARRWQVLLARLDCVWKESMAPALDRWLAPVLVGVVRQYCSPVVVA